MTNGPEQHSNHRSSSIRLEPLPSGFEPDLVRLDGRLAESLRDRSVPAGLADRTYRASVGLLPARRLPFVAAEPAASRFRLAVRRQWWGRLAMAAALGVAFVLAANALRAPVTGTPSPLLVADAGFSYLSEGPLDETRAEVSHILDTWTVRREDVTGELEAIVAGFELDDLEM